jgi:hypothetical protein
MSMPASACFLTTSATAARTRAANAARSIGTPSSLAYIMRMRSSGRGKLPVWVVKKRSALRTIVASAQRGPAPRVRYRRALQATPGGCEHSAIGAMRQRRRHRGE